MRTNDYSGRAHWLLALCMGLAITSLPAFAQDWPMFGQNMANTASASDWKISAANVSRLRPRWVATLGGDISARAAVVHGVVYVPDWGGNISAIDARTGQIIWTHPLSYYGLAAGTVSRTSPAVAYGLVFIGTQYNPSGPTGWLLAINAKTGEKVWMVQPDTSNAFPVITGAPSVAFGMLFVGMTSNEEFAAADPSYPCCSARGSIVALNAFTGRKLWQTFMAPAGYSGANVWGSAPVIDPWRLTLYVGTGNNFAVPPSYTACIKNGGTAESCLPSNDYVDSVVALNLLTGKVRWATRVAKWTQPGVISGSDFWNTACFMGNPHNCPPTDMQGPDFDFGSAPNEITYFDSNWRLHTIIGAGQKSGVYSALNPDTGAILWQTQVGPGSSLGGIEWGSASDGRRIYVAEGDFYGIPYNIAGDSKPDYAGSWAALDPATGKILWQVPDPNGAVDIGPLAVANGVVYAPSMGSAPTAPTMFALDASTGATLWSYPAGGSVVAGATIADSSVFWGSGYSHLGPLFTGNRKLFSFTLDGRR